MLVFSKLAYNAPQQTHHKPGIRRRIRFGAVNVTKETSVSKIARRQFLQLSAVAAAGYVAGTSRAVAQDQPKVSEDDPMAKGMRYTHDASTVDPSTRANPAAEQNCANCALVQGEDGDAWRPCQIFPGKLVSANGWCSVWAPKA